MTKLGKPVVLVVEDEPILRMMAVDIVEAAGLESAEASNADQAIAILEARSDIRIVFSDVDMPGSMDGRKLAACIFGRWPPIRLILTSGLFRLAEMSLPPGAVFFAKPYDRTAVMAKMRQMAA
jgi:CheY-like chemotaxis protein